MKNGEQERESLRIEAQRVRDELSDLKVETGITQDKLRKAEGMLDGKKAAKKSSPPAESAPASSQQQPESQQISNNADHSPTTGASSSPTAATPPSKSVASSMASDVATTPPSPPFSESSTTAAAAAPKAFATPGFPRARASVSGPKGAAPRASQPSQSSRHSRGPSIATSNGRLTPSVPSRRNTGAAPPSHSGLPKSGSLYQIRGIIGKMQKLEERVQSARSRLPVETPPRSSPRPGSALDDNNNYIPPTVTMRSAKKRGSGSVASSRDGEPTTPYYRPSYSRMSFGTPQATPSRGPPADESRPSSRTSISSRYSAGQSTSGIPQRSESRQSLTGRTPTSNNNNHHTSTSSTTAGGPDRHRPRSSLSNYNPSASMSYIDEHGGTPSASNATTSTTPRRTATTAAATTTTNKGEGTGIPTPGFAKMRQSGGGGGSPSKPGPARVSAGLARREGANTMPPPERKKSTVDLGETY